MQPITAKLMHKLPHYSSLKNLHNSFDDKQNSAILRFEPMVIDSAHLLLGRGERFLAYASPLPGTTIIVDGYWADNKPQWSSSHGNPTWATNDPKIRSELSKWIEGNQDIISMSWMLTSAGLMEIVDEVDVIHKGQRQRAVVSRFYDKYHWFDATDGMQNYRTHEVSAKQYQKPIIKIIQAYAKLAGLGYISLDPQYFVNKNGTVRITQLRNIYRMKAFPYKHLRTKADLRHHAIRHKQIRRKVYRFSCETISRSLHYIRRSSQWHGASRHWSP